MLKLLQVKEFTQETVTQEIAAEISAILAWNHLNESRYAGKFVINAGNPSLKLKSGNGGSSYHNENYDKDKYYKVTTGVEIQTPNNQTVRIWEDGRAIAFYNKDIHSDYEYLSRNKKTGTEYIKNRTPVDGANQARLINLYLEYGFYTIRHSGNILE